MATIYLDESGYTGDDLMNADQRFFVVASSLIGDDEATAVLRRSFPRYQGDEFKFTNIWKRETHRNSLRAFAVEIPALADRVFLWIIDKRFCLLTKMLDYLIEPPINAAGFDFYAGGYAQRYMNTAHRDILRHGSEALYETSIAYWDAFARSPDTANLAALEQHIDQVANSTKPPLSSLYDFARKGLEFFKARTPHLEDFENSSEIQLTSVLSSVIHWRQKMPDDFDIVHDESSNFLRQRDLWMTMLRDDYVAPPIEIGNGSIVEFPMRVRSMTSASSHKSAAIQLCDVLAGFGAKVAPAMEGRDPDPFLRELIELGAGELTHSGVMPHRLYATGLPPQSNGPDMVDRMVDLLEPELARMAARKAAARRE
jgi:hypothetical protein